MKTAVLLSSKRLAACMHCVGQVHIAHVMHAGGGLPVAFQVQACSAS